MSEETNEALIETLSDIREELLLNQNTLDALSLQRTNAVIETDFYLRGVLHGLGISIRTIRRNIQRLKDAKQSGSGF